MTRRSIVSVSRVRDAVGVACRSQTKVDFWIRTISQETLFFDRATTLAVGLAEHYARSGALVVFDLSEGRQDTDLFGRGLAAAHIVKYANDRLVSLGNQCGFVGIEMRTSAEKGLRYRSTSTGVKWIEIGAYEVFSLADSVGAGDWLCAGILLALSREKGPLVDQVNDQVAFSRAVLFGQALATLNCLAVGSLGLLRALPATEIAKLANELALIRSLMVAANPSQGGTTVGEAALSDFWNNLPPIFDRGYFSSFFTDFPCCSTLRPQTE